MEQIVKYCEYLGLGNHKELLMHKDLNPAIAKDFLETSVRTPSTGGAPVLRSSEPSAGGRLATTLDSVRFLRGGEYPTYFKLTVLGHKVTLHFFGHAEKISPQMLSLPYEILLDEKETGGSLTVELNKENHGFVRVTEPSFPLSTRYSSENKMLYGELDRFLGRIFNGAIFGPAEPRFASRTPVLAKGADSRIDTAIYNYAKGAFGDVPLTSFYSERQSRVPKIRRTFGKLGITLPNGIYLSYPEYVRAMQAGRRMALGIKTNAQYMLREASIFHLTITEMTPVGAWSNDRQWIDQSRGLGSSGARLGEGETGDDRLETANDSLSTVSSPQFSDLGARLSVADQIDQLLFEYVANDLDLVWQLEKKSSVSSSNSFANTHPLLANFQRVIGGLAWGRLEDVAGNYPGVFRMVRERISREGDKFLTTNGLRQAKAIQMIDWLMNNNGPRPNIEYKMPLDLLELYLMITVVAAKSEDLGTSDRALTSLRETARLHPQVQGNLPSKPANNYKYPVPELIVLIDRVLEEGQNSRPLLGSRLSVAESGLADRLRVPSAGARLAKDSVQRPASSGQGTTDDSRLDRFIGKIVSVDPARFSAHEGARLSIVLGINDKAPSVITVKLQHAVLWIMNRATGKERVLTNWEPRPNTGSAIADTSAAVPVLDLVTEVNAAFEAAHNMLSDPTQGDLTQVNTDQGNLIIPSVGLIGNFEGGDPTLETFLTQIMMLAKKDKNFRVKIDDPALLGRVKDYIIERAKADEIQIDPVPLLALFDLTDFKAVNTIRLLLANETPIKGDINIPIYKAEAEEGYSNLALPVASVMARVDRTRLRDERIIMAYKSGMDPAVTARFNADTFFMVVTGDPSLSDPDGVIRRAYAQYPIIAAIGWNQVMRLNRMMLKTLGSAA